MINTIEPKTYVYRKITSSNNSVSLPVIDKLIAKEHRPTLIYIDRVYSHKELLDKYSYEITDTKNITHIIQENPYETELIYDEYSNFDNLINNLRAKDYVALSSFTDFSWDWTSLVYRLSLLGQRGATFSAYGIYFDYPKDLLEVMQLGEEYSLPFDEAYIKRLLKLYKHHHKAQERLRNIPKMKSYDYEEGI